MTTEGLSGCRIRGRNASTGPHVAAGIGQRRWVLTMIRTVHSAIFLVMLSAIGWLVATGIAGRRDRSVAIAGAHVTLESVVFLANDGICPLTPLAERYGAQEGGVSDIFLPDVVARTIPVWATSLVVLGTALHVRGIAAHRFQ